MKSKGLQRLRWYCQVCQKQCRDENGFKCHAASESHLRQMLVVGESAGKHISDFSGQFQSEFVTLLSRRSVSSYYTSPYPILFASEYSVPCLLRLNADSHHIAPCVIQVGHQACQSKQRLPRVHPGQASRPHELHPVGHPHRIHQTPRPNWCGPRRRDRKGLVHHLDRLFAEGLG